MAAAVRFRFVDFLVRWLFTFALMAAIYNPTGYCYIDWLLVPESEYLVVKLFVGLTLVSLLWLLYAFAIRPMQTRGRRLGIVMALAGMWALDNLGLMPRTAAALMMLLEALLAAWLAFGMSLILLRQHVSGIVMSSDDHH